MPFSQTKPTASNCRSTNTWNVGVSFTYKVFTLDLRYVDTDLSKSNCDVLTSDHMATPSLSNVSSINPSGLGSNWCGATFVAKLSFDLTANTNLKEPGLDRILH